MRQDSATHENGYLLNDLDAGVTRLPRFLRGAHGAQERQQRRNAERRGDDRERTRRRVAHVLVHVINVRSHGGDHHGQSRRFRQIRDDFTTFTSRIIIFINQQRLDDNENFVYKRSNAIVEFVKNAIDDFDEQMTLLILECGRAEQRQDLIEESGGAKLARFVGDLTHGLFAHLRCAVFDFQQETHDATLALFFRRQFIFVVFVQNLFKVWSIFRFNVWQIATH
mmetsp:Transcript_11367/g.19016  ORF Transcript_11367/g.19016 Transcript_11367/m.19016 type:complete len:224 (-) Transcript_11367:1110-1781(-)